MYIIEKLEIDCLFYFIFVISVNFIYKLWFIINGIP